MSSRADEARTWILAVSPASRMISSAHRNTNKQLNQKSIGLDRILPELATTSVEWSGWKIWAGRVVSAAKCGTSGVVGDTLAVFGRAESELSEKTEIGEAEARSA